MKIALLTIEFHLPGCRSLKEKRARISPIREIYGKKSWLAICESGLQDNHQQAEWSFIIAAFDQATLDRRLSELECALLKRCDAVLAERHLERL